VTHLLKERTAKACVTKCLVQVPVNETTAWHTDVTCSDCLALMNPSRQRRRLVKKKVQR
jgi:hypothetical protein